MSSTTASGSQQERPLATIPVTLKCTRSTNTSNTQMGQPSESELRDFISSVNQYLSQQPNNQYGIRCHLENAQFDKIQWTDQSQGMSSSAST